MHCTFDEINTSAGREGCKLNFACKRELLIGVGCDETTTVKNGANY